MPISDLTVSILVGLQSITSPGQPTSTVPVLAVHTSSALTRSSSSPRVALGLRLQGGPTSDGEAVNLLSGGALSFRHLELGLGLRKPLPERFRFSLALDCGTASALNTNKEEASRRWCSAGIVFDQSNRGELSLQLGWDQRLSLDGSFAPVGQVAGRLGLAVDSPLDGWLFGRVLVGRGGKLRAEVGIGVSR